MVGGFDERRLVRTSQGHLHLWLAGEGRPLVLLHMALSSGRMFRHIAPLLAGHHHVIAPDRLGFGFSDHPSQPPQIRDYARATLEAIDGLGVTEFDVVGIHAGSTESIGLATAYPGRVRRVVTMTLPVFTQEEVAEFRGRHVHEPEPTENGSHLDWYWRWWRDGGVAGSAPRSREWDPHLLHEFFLDHLRSLPNAWFAHHAVFGYPMANRVSHIEQPLLVLHPYDSMKLQTERALAGLPGHAKVVRLPHLKDVLGHFTLAKYEVATLLREFLDG